MKTSFPPPLTSSRWGSRTKRIMVLITVLLMALALWSLRGMLPLMIVAALLSYLLWPLVNIIEFGVLGFMPFRVRSLAVLLTFVVVIAIFALVVILIAPALANQLAEVGRNLPEFFESTEEHITTALSRPLSIAGTPILIDGKPIIPLERLGLSGSGDFTGLLGEDFDLLAVVSTFGSSVSGLTGPAFSVLGGAVTAVINTAFLLIIMFYLMRDGDRFIGHLLNITPQSYQGDMRRMLYELGQVWNAYLRGQLILSVSVGMAVYLVSLVLGLPNAPVLGLLAGLLEFIPNLGPVLATVPAFLIALVSESTTIPFLSGVPYALAVIVAWTAIQQVESYYLVPRVMGGSLNLHPVVVIIGVLAGANLAGALGVILAAPFIATIRLVAQYVYGKIFDVDPFVGVDHTDIPRSRSLFTRFYQLFVNFARRSWQWINGRIRRFSEPLHMKRAALSTHQSEEETPRS